MTIKNRKILLGLCLLAYIVGFFFLPYFVSFTGIFAILMIMIAFAEGSRKNELLILSLFITYPIFLFFQLRHGEIVYSYLYAIGYGFIFKDFWSWINSKMKSSLVIVLSFLIFFNVLYGCFVRFRIVDKVNIVPLFIFLILMGKFFYLKVISKIKLKS